MRYLLIILALLLLPLTASATDYHIGAGQTYTSIAAFTGWMSLQPGDHVFIHPGTYKELLLLARSGTAENPIIVEGVLDEFGNRPVIDGENAITPTQFDGHMQSPTYQGYGVILVHRSLLNDAYGVAPEYIQIKNIEVMGNEYDHSFTNTIGSVQSFPVGGHGVYIKTGNHILVENCKIHDNGNGVGTQGVEVMAHDITYRGNHIYNNGTCNPARLDREHNAYNEASGITYEYNLFGPLKSCTSGSALKDRSANTVIRYNTIYSGARTLDLVEPENQSSWNCTRTVHTDGKMHDEPGFTDTWVYGNTFINSWADQGPNAAQMFHYGADNCPDISRRGTLHFYDNTTYIKADSGEIYNTRIFDLTTAYESVDLHNNVFYKEGTTSLYMVAAKGTVNALGGNWIRSGYAGLYTSATGSWNPSIAPITGTSPLFTDVAARNFSLQTGSPLIGAAVALPAGVSAAHNVSRQYLGPLTSEPRLGLADIGAFAYSGGSSPQSPTSALSGKLIGSLH